MSSKQELVEKIVHLLQTEFEPYRVTAGDRNFLEQSTVSYLDSKLQQLRNESTAKQQARALAQQDPEFQRAQAELAAKQEDHAFESAWTAIIRTPIGDRVVKPIEGNRSMIRGWINPGETPSFAWFNRILDENPSLVTSLAWDSADQFDPTKRKQLAEQQLADERQEFEAICRLQSLSECEANFNVWRSTNSITGLIPATAVELERYRQEEIAGRNERLLQADTKTLRAVARQEAVDQHQTRVQSQFGRELLAGYERDVVYGGKPPLPKEFQGKPLNAHFIKTCSPEIQRRLAARYGSSQLTARAHGITKIGKYNLA